MNEITKKLLKLVSDWSGTFPGAYHIREDGCSPRPKARRAAPWCRCSRRAINWATRSSAMLPLWWLNKQKSQPAF